VILDADTLDIIGKKEKAKFRHQEYQKKLDNISRITAGIMATGKVHASSSEGIAYSAIEIYTEIEKQLDEKTK